jgi:hypothetical protein
MRRLRFLHIPASILALSIQHSAFSIQPNSAMSNHNNELNIMQLEQLIGS